MRIGMAGIILVVVCWASAVRAGDFDSALEVQAEEMARCAAYYTLCYSALEMDREAAPENMMALDAGERAMEFAMMMSTRELSAARIERSMKDMLAKLNGDFSNLTLIIDEHGPSCKSAVENPFERLRYWLAQHRND